MHPPLGDVLDYSAFSIILRVKDLPNLLDILAAIPLDQVQSYRREM